MASVASSLSYMVFFYPFDTVRVRMSLDYETEKKTRLYPRTFAGMGKIRSQENFRALYSGFFFSAGVVLPYTALLLLTFDMMTPQEEALKQSLGDYVNIFGVAAIGSTLNNLLFYPFDTIRYEPEAVSSLSFDIGDDCK